MIVSANPSLQKGYRSIISPVTMKEEGGERGVASGRKRIQSIQQKIKSPDRDQIDKYRRLTRYEMTDPLSINNK